MTNRIQNMYRANGLPDCRLQTTEDLLKIHGIDFEELKGYARLDDVNRKLYEKFIVNFFNAWGLEARASITLRGIYFVEEVEYLAKVEGDDYLCDALGGIIYQLDRNGMKSILYQWDGEDEPKGREVIEETKQYLRFEYIMDGREGWLHVLSESSWY